MYQTEVSERQIADRIYELAAASGLDVASYLAALEQDAERSAAQRYDGLPREIIDELSEARQMRIAKAKEHRDGMAAKDVNEMLEHFPGTLADDIPQAVWDAVGTGIALKYAYALYLCDRMRDEKYADGVNTDAASRAASPAGKGECDEEFTPEMVDRMDKNDIKRNYKGILASIKKWKI